MVYAQLQHAHALVQRLLAVAERLVAGPYVVAERPSWSSEAQPSAPAARTSVHSTATPLTMRFTAPSSPSWTARFTIAFLSLTAFSAAVARLSAASCWATPDDFHLKKFETAPSAFASISRTIFSMPPSYLTTPPVTVARVFSRTACALSRPEVTTMSAQANMRISMK